MSEPRELHLTPLNDLHIELGGKMVPFAGYSMPVQYPLGIMNEHKHCRAKAGLFDVSHMGQVRLEGEGVDTVVESLCPIDLSTLEVGQQRYSFFTNEEGGILDDLMVTRAEDHLYLVVNAACKAQDFSHLQAALSEGQSATMMENLALMALQGPDAAAVLARFAPEVATMPFMASRIVDLDGVNCRVSRSGYTGEDGYEISIPADKAEAFARKLLAEDEVEAIGLGARDSLRLEAGLCLYGHDIDTTTTPVEAALVWAMGKRRREEGGFPGAEICQKQRAEGVTRKRVGILPVGRAPVREGAEITDSEGRVIGKITSGGFGPTVGGPVAMGYVEKAFAEVGTEVQVLVRGRSVPATIAKPTFVQQNYYRG